MATTPTPEPLPPEMPGGSETEVPPIDPPPATPAPPVQREVGGRGGPDPVRYGDWEKGGIAVDF